MARKPKAEPSQQIATVIRKADPTALKARDKNARFMTAAQLKRLTDNIARDGALTSLPLVYQRAEGRLEIISGHHRVQAAIGAGMSEIDVICITTELSETRLTGLQLSHNAITGQDDQSLLADLYSSLDLEGRKYSGLTDDAFAGLDNLGLASLGIGAVKYEELRITFLPEDQVEFEAYLKRIGKAAEKRPHLVAARADFDELFDSLIRVKEGLKVHNAGLALVAMARLACEKLTEIEATDADQPET